MSSYTKNQLGEEYLTSRDIMISIPSIIIAVNVLYLPRKIAQTTNGLDGIVGLTIGLFLVIILVYMISTITKNFPNQLFIDYASQLITKPLSILFIILFGFHGMLVTAFEIRTIAEISHLYLFNKTPIEVIALTFFLVVIYAVSGSRYALFRLQLLFFPLLIIISLFISIVGVGFINIQHSLPILETDFQGLVSSSIPSTLSIAGSGIIGYFLFYISLVKNPKDVTKKSVIGVLWAYFIILILFLSCILIFGKHVTTNLIFPVIELARSVEIPGEFFTRLESLLFIIWIITVFNTSIITFDIIIFGIQSIFKKVNKIKLILFLSPFIYLLSSLPNNFPELELVVGYIGYYGFSLTIIITFLLFIMMKIKGRKRGESH